MRYLRTNSREETFNEITAKLANKMVDRGYNKQGYNKQETIQQVKFKDRSKALQEKQETPGTKPLILSTRYSDSSKTISRVLNNHWHMIENTIFPNRPMVAHKKNPSLTNKLVRSKLRPVDEIDITSQVTERPITRLHTQTLRPIKPAKPSRTQDVFNTRVISRKCNEKDCSVCPILLTTNFVTRHPDGHKYFIRYEGATLTCTSSRVVYLLECKRCGKHYVGQTIKKLKRENRQPFQSDQRP